MTQDEIIQKCKDIIIDNQKYARQHKWKVDELVNVCLYEIDKTFKVNENGKETVSS